MKFISIFILLLCSSSWMKDSRWTVTGVTVTVKTTVGPPPNNSNSTFLCPDPLRSVVDRIGCESITCVNGLSPRDCEGVSAIFEPGLAMCGCCPGCVRYKGYGEPCTTGSGSDEIKGEVQGSRSQLEPPVILKNCKPGLRCSPSSKVCDLPEVEVTSEIKTCQNLCFMKRAVAEHPEASWSWTPSCDPSDGSFAPLQCKGTQDHGECFCVDRCGVRLFGRVRRGQGQGVTCGCSRRLAHLRSQGLTSTLHCTPTGDFETLQCDTESGLCYCVEAESGRLSGPVLPQGQWTHLPCFNRSEADVTPKYLKRCESEWVGASQLTLEAQLHGLKLYLKGQSLDCGFDGGFGPRQVDDQNREMCVYPNGEVIQPYIRDWVEDAPKMDCNCARDNIWFREKGLPITKGCQGQGGSGGHPRVGPGSYRIYYTFGDFSRCVDEDGYEFGKFIPKKFSCCLDDSCPLETKEECFEDGRDYVPCWCHTLARSWGGGDPSKFPCRFEIPRIRGQ